MLMFPIASPAQPQPELTELSLEDLMNVEVSSVSKKMEKLSEAAAAVFVITQEDIRHSGATSIPELLRMAPGVQVARIDANKWAIAIRGFNGRFSNQLLVLMDGRSIYTPFFSGVFWDVQDTMLEDIERIEVIRGPGSTLWGANALNGVINIITKRASDTLGGLITTGGGTSEKGFGSVRYGGKIGSDSYLRVYSKYFNRDAFVDSSGNKTADDWWMVRSGFRADLFPYSDNSFTLQGDVYTGRAGQTITMASLDPPYSTTTDQNAAVKGWNMLGRWSHAFSETSQASLQLYYDRTNREEPGGKEIRDTVDADAQHWFQLAGWNRVIWGLGYRFTRGKFGDTFILNVEPDSRSDQLYSAFLQDDIILLPDRLRLIVGSKFEHNDYTGFEFQPNGRLLWTPDAQQTVWASVSRAVRTPSRVEEDGRTNHLVRPPSFPFPATVVSYFGSTELKPEKLLAFELGYRNKITSRLNLDTALFYHKYKDLVRVEAGTVTMEGTHLLMPFYLQSGMRAESYGAELAADWQALDWWRLHAAYSFLEIELKNNGTVPGTERDAYSPRHTLSLRSNMDLRKNVELDLWFRYVGGIYNDDIPAYSTLDARIGWKPWRTLEFAIVGQNLFDTHHLEFRNSEMLGVNATEVNRSVYAKATWRF